jgi:hypothetical protein
LTDLVLLPLAEALERLGARAVRIEVLGGVRGGVWRVVRARAEDGIMGVTVAAFLGHPKGDRRGDNEPADPRGHHHGRERPMGGRPSGP